MYNEDTIRIPSNEAELWDVLSEQFEYVRHVLWDLHVETKEEALANGNDPAFRQGMSVIRYRDTGEQLDQRDHFLSMGRDLLPYIHQSLDERKLTPEFVQQWGKIMFCHGYIASYVFDDTDDLLPERNRHKGAEAQSLSGQPQRVFLARLVLRIMEEQSEPRKTAEGSAARAICKFINANHKAGLTGEHNIQWFESLLRVPRNHSEHAKDSSGNWIESRANILSSVNQDNLSEPRLRELAMTTVEGLPSIEMILATP